MVPFINLFFVPLVSVLIYCRQKQTPLTADLSLAVRYGVFVALVFLGARLLIRLAGLFLTVNAPPDSALYTLFAFLAAAIVPFVILFFQAYFRVTIRTEEKNDEKKT